MAENLQVEKLLTDSKVALTNGQYDVAYELAKEARRQQPNNADIHSHIGAIYFAQSKYEEAIKAYGIAVKFDMNNGNRYYGLGVAYAAANRLPEAVQYLARANELGCDERVKKNMHHILGMACYELGRYDDALLHFAEEQKRTGISVEILQRKAIIYIFKRDIKNGLSCANQIKLISPTSYAGYQIAYRLLKSIGKLEEAEKELKFAAKYVKLSLAYYEDCANLEMEYYEKDKEQGHLWKALNILNSSLFSTEPQVKDVMKICIEAADIYVKLKNGKYAIKCLKLLDSLVDSYNEGFSLLFEEKEEVELTEYVLEEMREKAIENIYENYGVYGVQEMAQGLETNEEGMIDFLTNINVDSENTNEKNRYYLKEDENIVLPGYLQDRVEEIGYSASMLEEKYDSAVTYARKMLESNDVERSHYGRYCELEALRMQGYEDLDNKYRSAIKIYERAVFRNPSDVSAVAYRIRCHIDIGEYEVARELSTLLAPEARKRIVELIETKEQGGEKDASDI